MKELENLVRKPGMEDRLIPLPGIGCSPKVWDEIERKREYAGMALDMMLSDSKYKVQEVRPELDNVIGSFNTSFYLIRDKKGIIIGEVKYDSGRTPFTVTSYDKSFEEKAKKIEKVLNDYNKPVYKLQRPVDDKVRILPFEGDDEVRILPYKGAVKHAAQPIYN